MLRAGPSLIAYAIEAGMLAELTLARSNRSSGLFQALRPMSALPNNDLLSSAHPNGLVGSLPSKR